jgi:molybdopterin-containing oxidoreductase family membrane subunit
LLLVLGLLSAGGVFGLVQIAQAGSRADWGYVAATEAFVLSTLAAAPPLALVSRLGRGLWGVPARRLAELLGLGSLVVVPLDILLLRQLPDWQLRPGIWLDWPGAPGAWHAAALVVLALASLALVWVTSLPDSRRWRGTPRQWYVVGLGVRAVGALYTLALVFTHLVVTSDLAMSLVPGWQSANFPAYHAVSAFEAGIASVVIGLAVMRKSAERATFHVCGKLLLALALLWFYFSWSEFLTYWYGRTPAEQDLITLLMAQPLYVGAALGCCVLPFLILLWNSLRASPAGVTAAAVLIVVGTFLDRIRVFVPAWAVAGPVSDHLEGLPALPIPTLADLLLVVGGPALAIFLVALAARVVRPVSTWEEREADVLRVQQPYLRTRVSVIGRPT